MFLTHRVRCADLAIVRDLLPIQRLFMRLSLSEFADDGFAGASLVLRSGVLLLGIAAAYWIAAEVGHALEPGAGTGFALLWPASGVYLVALLQTRRRLWPLIVLGAMLGNLASDVLMHGRAPWVALGFCLANTVEALTGAYLLRQLAPSVSWRLDGLRAGLYLLIFGALVAPMAGATLGATVAAAAYGGDFATAWPIWWSADAVGIVLVAPVMLALVALRDRFGADWRRELQAFATERGAELSALLLVAALTCWLVMSDPVAQPLAYLLLPSLLWAAIRFGPEGAAFVNLGVAGTLAVLDAAGIGPFSGASAGQNAIVLQTLLAAYAVTSMLVALLFLERRRAESTLSALLAERTVALSASQAGYRSIVEMSQDAIFVTMGNRIAYCNQAFVTLLGARSIGEVLGTPSVRIIPAEDRKRVRARIVDMIRSGGMQWPTVELRLRRLDGSDVVVETSATRYQTSAGHGLQVIARNVTERRQTLLRLQASEARFATLAQAVPAVLMTTDADGRCDYVNPSFSTYTGLEVEAARDDRWLDAIDPRDRDRVAHSWSRAVTRGERFAAEFRLRARSGRLRWFKSLAVPVRGPDGGVVQWIAVALDVEQHKRVERQLQVAHKRKDDFLAMLAHELRNPLAPIRTAGALLLRRVAPGDPIRDAAEIIDRQSAHLGRLVDELLEVSRVTRGKIVLTLEAVELSDVLRSGIEAATPNIERRHQRLVLALPPTGLRLSLDSVRFAQVIANLLDNASRYSPEGGQIELCVRVAEDAVLITVRDEGEGIASELLPLLFEPFVQAERSIDRTGGGLGLGLALVKALVVLHGGRVWAESQGPGRGACFSVRLPLGPKDQAAASAAGATACEQLELTLAPSRLAD